MREARLDVVLKDLPSGLSLPEACWLLARVATAIAAQPRAVAPAHVRIRSDGGVRVTTESDAPFAYRAPEEIAGRAPNVRSAVFSLGAVLVEAITGRPAFLRESDFETRIAVTQDEIPRLVGRVAQATPAIDAILRRALSKNPADRFASTMELAEHLDRFLEESLLEVGPDDLKRALAPFLKEPVDPRRESTVPPPAVEVARPAPAAFVAASRIALPEPAESTAASSDWLDRAEGELRTPAPRPVPEVSAPRKPTSPVRPAPDFVHAELDLTPENPRASAPSKPRLDDRLVRLSAKNAADSDGGLMEVARQAPRPAPRTSGFVGLPQVDEDALETERTRPGTMAPRTSLPPPTPNWLLRIAVALIALVVLAIAYQFLLRPLLASL
ncbi:MAG: hypothetical protein AB7S26_34145 [Sandaracinaceae bacterium]